jgi:hypothetical protein
LGLPGASSWREGRDAPHLEGIPAIYILIEPDQGGKAVRKWLDHSSIRDRARLVSLQGHKGPSDLHLAATEGFRARFQKALDAAEPWTAIAAAEAEEAKRAAWETCRDLARSPRILDRFISDLRSRGVVGEERLALLLYLAMVSRLLDRPVSLVVKGPSSAGKSYVALCVLEFFPPESYHALSGMSERTLAYSDQPLSHRVLVIYEVAGMQSELMSYLLRSLLSEGRVRYETVEKGPDGELRTRTIEREGPTGLVVTTTAVDLHPENETRLFSVPVTDTQEQTRAVLLSLADESERMVDFATWHALQEWLGSGERQVTIPFARRVLEKIPPCAVRLRRDISAVLSLVRSHALLHRASREIDAEGRVVASLDDYAVVRELVADLVAAGVEATVPDTVRQTVAAVVKLVGGSGSGVTVAAVGKALRLDKSAALRRVKSALARGYLRNTNDGRRGRPYSLVVGEPLPEDQEILPKPKDLGTDGEEER